MHVSRSHLCGLFVAPLFVLTFCAPVCGASDSHVPAIISRFAGFEGRIEYTGHRSDVASAPLVQGTVFVSPSGFALRERSPRYTLDVDPDGAVLRTGPLTAHAADTLDADALVNPWAVAVAALSRGGLVAHGRLGWGTPNGIIVYTDTDGTRIAGMADASQAGRLEFTFAGWADVAGIAFPTRIVRVRNGVTDATFQIDRLDVTRGASKNLPSDQRSVQVANPVLRTRAAAAAAGNEPAARAAPAFPWHLVSLLFGSMLLAVAIVAWLRRDAFSAHRCAQLAADSRGWQSLAVPAFVSADGLLHIEGNDYRVGPEFFARAVEVQHSALFLRVSAPGITKAVVFPRRLPRPDFVGRRRHRPASRPAAAGLSLIETLVATAFFAVVLVGAVYPAITAIARADYVAAQKRAAILAIANALTDEEMACAYGTAAPTGTSTTTAGDFTITTTVTDVTGLNARNISVSASDASGRVLAAVATTVGPPVPPPGTNEVPPSPPPSFSN